MFFGGFTFAAIRRSNQLYLVAAVLVALLMQLPDAAAQGPPAPGKPIMAKLIQDMDFGSVVATSPTGTVTLYPSGQSPSYSGVTSIGGIVTPAAFSVLGERLQPFTIILPTAPIVIPGPTGDMVIDNFVSDPPAGANGTFDAQGKATVTVGATMSVTDQLSAGPYNSTFDLTVSY